jgi:AraC-like DNA-binding protein
MKSEKKTIPYWEKGVEWKEGSFYIRKLESKSSMGASEVPRAALPRYSFLFMLEGELLVEIADKSYLCRGGQFLLIPDNTPFAVHHFRDLVGYIGSFPLSFLKDTSYPCLTSGKTLCHTFWFDEAAFVAEIMDRISAASARGDDGYILRAFDLILYGLKTPAKEKAHPVVSRFMEMLFDRQQVVDTVSGYASRLEISPSYLNKLVRTQTRHSAMDWVEIARVNWAKNLLREDKLSIAEVSKAIGVDDASYFTRFFRKVTGYTPSEFRKREATKPELL